MRRLLTRPGLWPLTRLARRPSSALVAVAALALLLGGPASVASAHRPNADELQGVRFDPHLGAPVPLDLTFRDETGRAVPLRSYLTGRPVVLTLNYFSCPNLCPLMVQDLATSLSDLKFRVGDDYTVLTVSIDPRDTPELAASKKAEFLRPYAPAGAAEGWHFLTGDQPSIDRLADAVGFNYVYDDEQGEYAHPAGVIVLTPAGRIARYLFGLDYPSTDLRLAIVEAAGNTIGTVADQVLLLCYHYDPANGRYTPIVLTAVRAAGALTVLGLGLFLGLLWHTDRRRMRQIS